MSAQDPSAAGDFGSLYSHGFIRVAAAVPHVQIAEPSVNAQRTLALARRASDERAALVVFPELGLSGYSIEDLFHQQALTDSVLDAVGRLAAESADLASAPAAGPPLRAATGLPNPAAV